jgi:beta-phosphoglucomutase
MTNWPAAVLFDFDGVIVNSEPLHFRAFRQVLAEERIDLTEQEYYQDLIGFDDRGALRHLFEKRGLPLEPKTLLRLMARKSRAMMEQIYREPYQALSGVEALVRGLWRTYPLGICSGSVREEIEVMLEGVSLRDCFSTIVAAEDVTAGKPDPQGYLLCAKQLGERIKKSLRPQDCLVIEDAPTVIRSVKSAGFRTLGVASTYFPDKLRDADWVVRTLDPDEVLRHIPELKLIR